MDGSLGLSPRQRKGLFFAFKFKISQSFLLRNDKDKLFYSLPLFTCFQKSWLLHLGSCFSALASFKPQTSPLSHFYNFACLLWR